MNAAAVSLDEQFLQVCIDKFRTAPANNCHNAFFGLAEAALLSSAGLNWSTSM